MSVLGDPVVSGVIGAAAMLGPGRQLLYDGVLSLSRYAPRLFQSAVVQNVYTVGS
jgi:hypothetical protein